MGVEGVVEAGHDDIRVMKSCLDPEPSSPPVARGEPFVDLPVRHVLVRAPQLTDDLGVEVGVVRKGARLGSKHGDLSIGKQIGDQSAVDGCGDRPGCLAEDDDLGSVGKVLGEVVERRRAVDESLMLDGQSWRVLTRDIAKVRVSGAKGHVDEAVVDERIVSAGEIEHPALPCWILARDVRVIIWSRPLGGRASVRVRAARRVETHAAPVEVEYDLGWVGLALPKGELATVGTLAVAARHNLLPYRIAAGV